MDKSFDDLFNEFFKPKSNFDLFNTWMNEAKNMFNMFQNPINNSFNDSLEDEMEKALGQPDEILYYTEKDIYFEKRIWHTKQGDIIKTVMSDDPTVFGEGVKFEKVPRGKEALKEAVKKAAKEKPLDLQLQEALEKEDYEKAAEIRDLMNPPKKKRGRPKKLEK